MAGAGAGDVRTKFSELSRKFVMRFKDKAYVAMRIKKAEIIACLKNKKEDLVTVFERNREKIKKSETILLRFGMLATSVDYGRKVAKWFWARIIAKDNTAGAGEIAKKKEETHALKATEGRNVEGADVVEMNFSKGRAATPPPPAMILICRKYLRGSATPANGKKVDFFPIRPFSYGEPPKPQINFRTTADWCRQAAAQFS